MRLLPVLLFVFPQEAAGDCLGVPDVVRRAEREEWGTWEEISGLECQEESRAGFVGVGIVNGVGSGAGGNIYTQNHIGVRSSRG